MKLKKIIPVILVLFVGIILACIRNETAVSPDKETFSPVPTVLSQEKTPEPTPATQTPDAKQEKKKKKQTIPTREALIDGNSFYLRVLQTDGTLDEYHVCSDRMPIEYVEATIRSTNWVYYCLSSGMTLYRIPIQQDGDKIKLLPKSIESLSTIESSDFIYATDQYVIYEDDACLLQLNVQTGEKKKLPIPGEEDEPLYWHSISDYNEKLVIDKELNFYSVEINEETDERTFYKIGVDTFQKSKLSDQTNAILLDSSGEVVIMEADETWNYAFYPKTGKRYRCGRNMYRKWKKGIKDSTPYIPNDTVGFYTATNRDLVEWIQKNNPWSYQKKKGCFCCVNQFVYKNRMYVKVGFEWIEPGDEDVEDEDLTDYTQGMMLFSYSLKNYKGIRPEEQINKTMQNTSEKTYGGSEDDEHDDSPNTVTGDFTFLFEDTLVFAHDKYNDKYIHYGLYNLRTHQYKKVKKKNGDSKYLDWLHSM